MASEVNGIADSQSSAPPSPTPSEILKPEGLMPRSPCVTGEEDIENNPGSESPDGASEINGEESHEEINQMKNGDDNNSEDSSSNVSKHNKDNTEETNESDFLGFETSTAVTTSPTTPPAPKVGSLTILAPSSLNSSVMNGTLSISSNNTMLENNNSLESFRMLGAGLTIDSVSTSLSTPTLNGNPGINSMNSNDPLDLLQGFIDNATGDNMEYMPLDRLATGTVTCDVCGAQASDPVALDNHKSNAGHYKCYASSDCSNLIFSSKTDLSNHGIQSHSQQLQQPGPMDQLSQQVQRLPPVSAYQSPSHQPHHLSPATSPSLQQSHHYRNTQSPFLQPRASVSPHSDGSGSPGVKRQLEQSNSLPDEKKRRLDMLPNRNDEVDCHVIAHDSGIKIQNVQGGNNQVFNLPNSISIMPTAAKPQSQNDITNKDCVSSDPVANILAARGISISTTTGGNARSPISVKQPSLQTQITPVRNSIPNPVQNLNINPAITILPASQTRQNTQQQQQKGFVVPRIRNQSVKPSVVLPTVDLTQDVPSGQRGRPPGRLNRQSCPICDKAFPTADALNQHMMTHNKNSNKNQGKLPYRCNNCSAQYPTHQGLIAHQQTFHKEAEFVIPIVDIKQPGNVNKLAQIGIRQFIPLAQLQSQNGGTFGLPIVNIDSAKNPAICNLGSLGASNALPLGPMKSIAVPPRRGLY